MPLQRVAGPRQELTAVRPMLPTLSVTCGQDSFRSVKPLRFQVTPEVTKVYGRIGSVTVTPAFKTTGHTNYVFLFECEIGEL